MRRKLSVRFFFFHDAVAIKLGGNERQSRGMTSVDDDVIDRASPLLFLTNDKMYIRKANFMTQTILSFPNQQTNFLYLTTLHHL
jgi:hypothetical protein